METTPAPPAPYPSSKTDDARWSHTRLRRRLLSGNWHADLEARREALLDPSVKRMQGQGDVTKNPYRSAVNQLAQLYDQEPTVAHAQAGAAEAMDRELERAGVWQLAIRHHRYVVGLRESLQRLSVHGTGSAARLGCRLVTPDFVEAFASPDEPDVPHTVREYRLRRRRSGQVVWSRDVLSVADPANPIYRVETEKGEADAELGPDLSGERYPYRWTTDNDHGVAGEPFLPYTLTHAVRTGELWDGREGAELVWGSLNVGVLYSFWNHVVRDASWPQRWVFNARPGGGVRTDDNDENIAYLPSDPTSILVFVGVDGKPGSAGQWEAGGDPETLLRAINDYAKQLAVDYGINPTDIHRTTGNAMSGYAVALTQNGVRAAQRKFGPEGRRSDRGLLGRGAAMLNRARNRPGELPESGWQVTHRGVPMSLEEERLTLERHKLRMELGLASRVDLYRQLEGVTH